MISAGAGRHAARPYEICAQARICVMLSSMMMSNSYINSSICVREATADDAAAVVRLIRQLGEDSEVTEDYVLHYLGGSDHAILLAQQNDHIEGLLSYSVRADLYHAGNSVLIEELVVEKGSRGKGIGGD